MRSFFIFAAVAVGTLLGSYGICVAQTDDGRPIHHRDTNSDTSSARHHVVPGRSFLDPGNYVPPGTDVPSYISDQTQFNEITPFTYQPATFGATELDNRFAPDQRPMFTFEGPAF